MKLIETVSRIILLILLALCVIVGVMFYVGGSNGTLDVAGDLLSIPRYTDIFLYLNYALVGLACLITLAILVINFGYRLKYNPKGALKSLIPVVLFILVFVVSWYAGSPEKLEIIGYEGTENVGFWAQCTDMFLYVSYILLGVTILTLFGMAIYTKVRK